MKNIAIFSAVAAVALMASASSAFAAPTDFITNGDPMAVTQPWGLTGHQTPVVNPGTVVVDEGGIQDTCPFFYNTGCFNLAKTDFYRNQMLDLGSKLKAQGITGGYFGGWIAKAK